MVIESGFATKLDSVPLTPGKATFEGYPIYECDFGGIHFSRSREADLIRWVRVCAKRMYGKDTQVIFLHHEKG